MPSPDGYLFEFDSYTEASGDAFLTLLRPRSATDGADEPITGGALD